MQVGSFAGVFHFVLTRDVIEIGKMRGIGFKGEVGIFSPRPFKISPQATIRIVTCGYDRIVTCGYDRIVTCGYDRI
ncbi:MAG: hypothetical protein WEB37_07390, partial [Bacteroidota bacterium]